MNEAIIFWFRQDLRLKDNPGLHAAIASGKALIPVYILDDESPSQWRLGQASRWWLHHSLSALNKELKQHYGTELILRRGSAKTLLPKLCDETGADAVFCSRQYEPWAAALEQDLHHLFQDRAVSFKRFAGSLLFEPGSILTQAGGPFKVFTAFWRRCRSGPEPALPLGLPKAPQSLRTDLASDTLTDWQLLPDSPNWAAGWETLWQPGAEGAAQRLQQFLNAAIDDYQDARDIPAQAGTSLLSAHLSFGEISPRMVWHATKAKVAQEPSLLEQSNKFLSELAWREFSHHLLHFFPHLPQEPFKAQFAHFPWESNPTALQAWQQGQTGYPMVDAGMRELWQSGYMHNRLRMIVASFLTKHLRLHWRLGERWFWDCLVDANLANNASGWQWVAGSGADASPYFRIFNPTTQGEKFDPQGDYIRRWVPELAGLPNKYLHQPSKAPAKVLEQAGLVLGENYPLPIVEHNSAREQALSAYAVARESFNL